MMQQLPVLSGIDLKDPGLKMEAFMEQWAGNLDTPWQLRQVMATLIPRLAGDFVRFFSRSQLRAISCFISLACHLCDRSAPCYLPIVLRAQLCSNLG